MLRFLIFGALIVHGLITTARLPGLFARNSAPKNLVWLNWWPTLIGRSGPFGSSGRGAEGTV